MVGHLYFRALQFLWAHLKHSKLFLNRSITTMMSDHSHVFSHHCAHLYGTNAQNSFSPVPVFRTLESTLIRLIEKFITREICHSVPLFTMIGWSMVKVPEHTALFFFFNFYLLMQGFQVNKRSNGRNITDICVTEKFSPQSFWRLKDIDNQR